ncbi:MAG TPA: carboxypeptidase regulatory-like domain-containing protein, partial [Planctomycetes bacterium]|nr:carboxypeptidase regulatory-like domain-containing protein [Planctomycetota bacterium]
EPVQWDFDLEVGHRIAGQVLGPDRSGVPGVRIDAISQSGTTGSRGSTVSGKDGEFLIEDLGEGIYTLRAQAEGYQTAPLQRVETDRTDVEILLAEQGGVEGRVVDAATGKPMRGFTVRIRTLHPRNVSWGGEVAKTTVRDQADGSFRLGGISEGDYVAEAFARGYASSFSAPFHVDQGIQTRDVVVRLTKGGTIHGKVLDAYTGQPVQGAIVRTNENNYVDSEIMLILNSMGSSATSKASTKTDANGEFTLSLLTPDTYQVRVEKPGYTTLILNDVSVDDGPATEVGSFSLSKGAIVTGTVLGPDDEPIAGAQVTMRSTDSGVFGSYETRTDAHGNFVLENAKAGTFSLAASRPPTPNSNPFAPVIDIQNSEIEITLADGGTYQYELRLPARADN